MIDKVELKKILNDKYGEMYQLLAAGDPVAANSVLDELVEELSNG